VKISVAASIDELEKVKVSYVGRKGSLTEILKNLSTLPVVERKTVGEKANKLRVKIESEIEEKTKQLKRQQTQGRLESEKIEISARLVFPFVEGHQHPLSETLKQVHKNFRGTWF